MCVVLGSMEQSLSCQGLKNLDSKSSPAHTHTQAHNLTHQPVAACGYSGIFASANQPFQGQQERAVQQLPLHTNALQMKFIYSTLRLQLSLSLSFSLIFYLFLFISLSLSLSLPALCLLTCSPSLYTHLFYCHCCSAVTGCL